MVPSSQREVTIGCHRADIVTTDGMVVELQASSISPQEIRAREAEYRRMVWVIKADTMADHLDLREQNNGYVSFRWRHPRQSLWAVHCPMWWDLVDIGMIEVKKIHHNIPCGGWGYRRGLSDFLERYLPEATC
jgi:competence CoiA-like predicted nuclease